MINENSLLVLLAILTLNNTMIHLVKLVRKNVEARIYSTKDNTYATAIHELKQENS